MTIHPFPLPSFRIERLTAGTFYGFPCGCWVRDTPVLWTPMYCPEHLLEGDALSRRPS